MSGAIPCPECDGTGQAKPDCPTCEGFGVIEDLNDDGALIECHACHDEKCGRCKGTGLATGGNMTEITKGTAVRHAEWGVGVVLSVHPALRSRPAVYECRFDWPGWGHLLRFCHADELTVVAATEAAT